MADHGFLGGPPRPRRDRRPVLCEEGSFGPLLNGFEDGTSPTCSTAKKGRTLRLFALHRGQWPNPRGSATFESARECRSTPQTINRRRPSEECETAMTEAWWPRGGQQFGSSMLGG
ncbi:hypothetical protein CXB51_027250 [Gossypium anomalum]|uniref:Uncharacterized protein n=1 Tax=Gossypium anomalum TaxID=47600 RepID=A0A8J5YFI2_9ROSI|nr:hypothetical protein CXB51_027250 [Gossypium anomalum]